MPAAGRPYNREKAAYKAECKKVNAQCWLCRGDKGPIDYDSKYNPKQRNNLAFTVDHVTPTSLGGDPLARSNWKPAHSACNTSRGNSTRGQFPTTRQW